MKRVIILTAILAIMNLSFGDGMTEMCRIRVTNSVDGPVQVSLDQGKSYTIVGRVTLPASKCIPGFAASAYAQDGKVTAVAVHAIRIRAGSMKVRDGSIPQVFSIIPKEFSKPGGFGTGEVAGDSGIYTDIPSGTAIFRNLSPLVGNSVYLEKAGAMRPLPADYVPSAGDIVVIVAEAHDVHPSELIIENRRGGAVDAVYADRKETIAIVERPVRGTGRFDATEFTGVGNINTNHPGCITVSTAPVLRGRGSAEPRGGFQILPSKHADRIGYIPQYMVVAPATGDSPPLEGSPLLFSEHIGLAYDPLSPSNSFRVDIRVGDGDWRPLPAIMGKHDNALMDFDGSGKSVTHIRLRFPLHSEDWLRRQLRLAADGYLTAKYKGKLPASGRLSFSLAGNELRDVRFASLYVDGQFVGISSTSPYAFSVDAEKLDAGEHCVEIRGSSDTGVMVKSTKQWFYTALP